MNTKTLLNIKEIAKTFKFPLIVLLSIIVSIILNKIFHATQISTIILFSIVIVGSIPLFKENIESLMNRKYALDYIALLAIVVGILSGQLLVAAVIILMLSGGSTLENYGTSKAKLSLTALTDRIPNSVYRWKNDSIAEKVENDDVQINDEIFVRKGEVIPLDGILQSELGFTDESSLTGEPYMIDKIRGDQIRSGTVNVGEGIVIKVSKVNKDSTYHKIIEMVQTAQREKAPLIRLADKYSAIFTIVTIVIAVCSYLLSGDWGRVLSVLVIATPCPLILATPIALMGGMNASAKQRIIMKRLSCIEVLSRVNTIIFDKTGTITIGKPFVKNLTVLDSSYTQDDIFSIAEAIERNSLHPLAKAIIEAARKKKSPIKRAVHVKELIGSGIIGEVDGNEYTLSKVKNRKGMAIQISKNTNQIGIFEFEDKLKENSKDIIKQLTSLGLELHIFTGDKLDAAKEVADQLGIQVTIKANCTPEDKKNGIEMLKKMGRITTMVGDGINDAPALAVADVGMVFSNEEQTAASEAADIVFLGGDFSSVIQVIDISKTTIHIALQSILFGIAFSTIGMLFAATGFIVPIVGAFIQESIDVLVILNALRTSRLR